MKSVIEKGILVVVDKIIYHKAKKTENGWPPICASLLHQPKRPITKTKDI